MSNSIAAAKRRRAGVIEQSPQPVPSSSSSNATSASRLTLPQIIALFDTRISKLENTPLIQYVNEEKNASIAEYVQEMDHKFNILVDEITALKDIVIKLQSFTMEVNKTLVQARIQIMSEFEGPNSNKISTEENNLTL